MQDGRTTRQTSTFRRNSFSYDGSPSSRRRPEKRQEISVRQPRVNDEVRTAEELARQGRSPSEILRRGFSVAELREAGFSAAELRRCGVLPTDLLDGGYSMYQLKLAGISFDELIGNTSAQDLEEGPVTVEDTDIFGGNIDYVEEVLE